MVKIVNLFNRIILLTSVCLLFSTCTTSIQTMQTKLQTYYADWNNAEYYNSLKGYEEFMEKYPDTDLAKEAERRISDPVP